MAPHSATPTFSLPRRDQQTFLRLAPPRPPPQVGSLLRQGEVCLELYFIDTDPRDIKLENYRYFLGYTVPNSYTNLLIFCLIISRYDQVMDPMTLLTSSWVSEHPSLYLWQAHSVSALYLGCWRHHLEPTPLPRVWDQVPTRTGDHLLHPRSCLLPKVSPREAGATSFSSAWFHPRRRGKGLSPPPPPPPGPTLGFARLPPRSLLHPRAS